MNPTPGTDPSVSHMPCSGVHTSRTTACCRSVMLHLHSRPGSLCAVQHSLKPNSSTPISTEAASQLCEGRAKIDQDWRTSPRGLLVWPQARCATHVQHNDQRSSWGTTYQLPSGLQAAKLTNQRTPNNIMIIVGKRLHHARRLGHVRFTV